MFNIDEFRNQCLLGNCLDEMKKIPDNSIDLTVTSPPYDNLRDYDGYTFDFENIAKELFRITKIGATVVWVVGDATIKGSETGTSFKQALYFKQVGFNLHDTMIYLKPGFSAVGALKTRYAPVFEYMFILTKGKIKTFNPLKDRICKHPNSKLSGTIRNKDGSMKRMSGEGKIYAKDGLGQRYNVWEINPQSNGHPAPFPLQLAIDHILSWSNEHDIVLDPFMGSGTTCIACKKTNRDFIGIEISSKYYQLACERINENLQTIN